MSAIVSEELIFTGVRVGDAEEAIRFLADRLLQKGCVAPEFPDAVVEREKKFPTGLPTPGIGVAIPHTDKGHVLTPRIAVAVLESPVFFGEMGNPEKKVSVELVFLLAIRDPKAQLENLKKLMALITDREGLREMRAASSAEEIFERLSCLN